uniref:Interferon regulatory factor 8 n=1 Tax=Papio anubis TaxID=9555 RepID=A0A8I5N381_PAPAN
MTRRACSGSLGNTLASKIIIRKWMPPFSSVEKNVQDSQCFRWLRSRLMWQSEMSLQSQQEWGQEGDAGAHWSREAVGRATSATGDMTPTRAHQAWAVFKGKFKEGDKAEPATWKTRLRCALNKSPDFEEVTDRSQLDISEPYKVYRIVPEEEQKCKLGVATAGCVNEVTEMECARSEIDELIKEPSVDDYMGMIKRSPSPPEACRSQLLPDWWAQQPSTAFSQMVISFYYGGKLVGQATTTCPEGCRLSLSQPGLPGTKLYGPEGLELVRFPPADAIPSERQRQVTRKLFGHLERGVLLHSSRQGVFVKRLCQGRVFCSGNAVVCKGRPNKLERDEVVQVFDTSQFFRELQQFYNSQGRLPDGRVVLCFGEEFPDMAPLRSKLILVQIEQLYVRQLAEEAGKSCGAGSVMQAPEEPPPDQVFRMFPDICASHQRPFFRENQQITV